MLTFGGIKMREEKVNVLQLKTGMVLSRSIYDDDGRLLLPQDFVLTEKAILQLKFYGLDELYIKALCQVDVSQDYESDRVEKIRQTPDFKAFEGAHQETVKGVKEVLNQLVIEAGAVNTTQLLDQVEHIIATNKNNMQVFDMLHCIRSYDDLTYVHCVNVALICNIMGKWLGYSKKDIEVLTLAGLLHDTGKLMMPKEIITKPGRLTPAEYAVIKTHPEVGFHILSDVALDDRIRQAAYEHHEKCDGTGYPRGLKADEISSFAKIVAIADVYDAMTADRIYRPGICPFSVIELFEAQGFGQFDVVPLMVFMEHIVETYINKQVLLSDGHEAKIIMINKNRLSRPVVTYDDQFVDLAKDHSIGIRAVL